MDSERQLITSNDNVCAALEMLLNTMRLLSSDEMVKSWEYNEDGTVTITIRKEVNT